MNKKIPLAIAAFLAILYMGYLLFGALRSNDYGEAKKSSDAFMAACAFGVSSDSTECLSFYTNEVPKIFKRKSKNLFLQMITLQHFEDTYKQLEQSAGKNRLKPLSELTAD
jgi:hypothetical protein